MPTGLSVRASLRTKVALAFSGLAAVLLLTQAIAIKALAETEEERFVDAVIEADMRDLLDAYRTGRLTVPRGRSTSARHAESA
jgi:hypothetical protein